LKLKKLTLEEIGKLAGVSRATVSRVVNDYPHISPEIRERVEKLIAETGYQPNVIARSLVSDRTNIIGLVIPSHVATVFTDPYFPRLIQGISHTSNQSKLTLSLFLFHSREEEEYTMKSILNTGLIDGLIVTADRKEDSIIPRLMHHNMPFVVIGRPDTRPDEVNFVDTDNVAGARMATEYLVSLGYRRIGIIASKQNTAGDDRLVSYMKVLEQNNIPIDKNLIAYGDFSMTSGAEAMKTLYPHRPEAVFVCSDSMAMGAMTILQEAGVQVPQDMAIVGYDDLPPAIQVKPALTTIHQPIAQSGQRAVALLMDLINGMQERPNHIILPNKLIIRSSCGAALMNKLNDYISEDIVIEV
jgi:LacI family transcriptional regulator